MTMNNVVVLLSGGMDSTTLLYRAVEDCDKVRAISFNYGQRHKKELDYAIRTTELLQIEHEIVDLSGIQHLIAGDNALTGDVDVPEGHYADENMKQTVVPNRNMIMLSIAAGWAISNKADAVLYAAHSGDHTIYPDCRPEFSVALDTAIRLADWHEVHLVTPFMDVSKAYICNLGNELGVDYNETWSCYKGGQWHCGVCGTCVERKEAFELSGVTDPTIYELTEADLPKMADS